MHSACRTLFSAAVGFGFRTSTARPYARYLGAAVGFGFWNGTWAVPYGIFRFVSVGNAPRGVPFGAAVDFGFRTSN